MSITYDLYVKQSGRWFLERQYERDARSDAVSEAKKLFTMPGVAATRVIRERYDRDSLLSIETTVFDSTEEAPVVGTGSRARREFGRRGKLPPDVHHQWQEVREPDNLEHGDGSPPFDDDADIEFWQIPRNRSVERFMDWKRAGAISLCVGGGAALVAAAVIIL